MSKELNLNEMKLISLSDELLNSLRSFILLCRNARGNFDEAETESAQTELQRVQEALDGLVDEFTISEDYFDVQWETEEADYNG